MSVYSTSSQAVKQLLYMIFILGNKRNSIDVLKKNARAPSADISFLPQGTIEQKVWAFNQTVLHRSEVQHESYFLDKIFDGMICLFVM